MFIACCKKKLGSLSSGFLPCNAAHCMCKCYLALVGSPVGSGTQELVLESANSLTMIAVSSKDLSV